MEVSSSAVWSKEGWVILKPQSWLSEVRGIPCLSGIHLPLSPCCSQLTAAHGRLCLSADWMLDSREQHLGPLVYYTPMVGGLKDTFSWPHNMLFSLTPVPPSQHFLFDQFLLIF